MPLLFNLLKAAASKKQKASFLCFINHLVAVGARQKSPVSLFAKKSVNLIIIKRIALNYVFTVSVFWKICFYPAVDIAKA